MIQLIHSESPVVAISEALKLLKLAFRLQWSFRQGLISEDCFTKDVPISSGTGTYLPAKEFSKDEHEQLFHNQVLSALCSLAIAVDKALDNVFGHKNPKNTGDVVVSLRAVFYMLRCAWAHDVTNPKWHRYPNKYEGVYKITVPEEIVCKVTDGRIKETRDFEFDFEKLNGEYVDFGPFGGVDGIFYLAAYAHDLIISKTDASSSLEG